MNGLTTNIQIGAKYGKCILQLKNQDLFPEQSGNMLYPALLCLFPSEEIKLNSPKKVLFGIPKGKCKRKMAQFQQKELWLFVLLDDYDPDVSVGIMGKG